MPSPIQLPANSITDDHMFVIALHSSCTCAADWINMNDIDSLTDPNELNAALTRLSVEEPISMEQLIQYLSEVPHLRQ